MTSMERRPDEDNNDSEDDPDFVPPEDGGSSSDEERKAKRLRTSSSKLTEQEQEAKGKSREALWQEFQSSVSTPAVAAVAPPKTVKIEKCYRFAGEEVREVKEVPENSEEAKQWPRWHEPSTEENQASSSVGSSTPSVAVGEAASSSTSAPGEKGTPASTARPAKRPGPRKSKIALAPLPSTQKAKKLTTLDKSAMDWRSHIDSNAEPIKDELEANRRGGGYLEKVEFLQRVADRKDEALEASKSTKRRR